jgi:phosphoribosylamine---glycine ligase
VNVLVIGSGAREHCLAYKISLSKNADEIFLMPGNAGHPICEKLKYRHREKSFPQIYEAIKKYSIDLTVVGPEAPLVDGIVDYLSQRGHPVFGPSKKHLK